LVAADTLAVAKTAAMHEAIARRRMELYMGRSSDLGAQRCASIPTQRGGVRMQSLAFAERLESKHVQPGTHGAFTTF